MFAITAGVDVGSQSIKVVIVDNRYKILSFSILRYDIMQSGFTYKDVAKNGMREALQTAGLSLDDIGFVISTGLGKAQVDYARQTALEITCRARGTKALLPQVRTVLDIGSQDSNVIYLNDDGSVSQLVKKNKCMSGDCKCAAGTGYFLASVAATLQVDWRELGELWFNSKNILEISDVCTISAGSEVTSLFIQGFDKADIAAAAHRYVAKRIASLLEPFGVREKVCMIGGVAKNAGLRRAVEEKLHIPILISEEPQIADAYGAAIIAGEQLKIIHSCGTIKMAKL